MQQCVQTKWAAAGRACDGTTRCLVGSCPPNNNGVGGTCPKVIADGKPCNPTDASATCDTFSQCLGGKCHLGFAGVCP
jgi:hypothetical protein